MDARPIFNFKRLKNNLSGTLTFMFYVSIIYLLINIIDIIRGEMRFSDISFGVIFFIVIVWLFYGAVVKEWSTFMKIVSNKYVAYSTVVLMWVLLLLNALLEEFPMNVIFGLIFLFLLIIIIRRQYAIRKYDAHRGKIQE